MVHTVEDNPAKVLLRERHLHDESKGRQDLQTLSHGFFILQIGITLADQLVVANIFSTQSMKCKSSHFIAKAVWEEDSLELIYVFFVLIEVEVGGEPLEIAPIALQKSQLVLFYLTQAVSNLQKLLVVIVGRQPGGVFGPDIKQSGGTPPTEFVFLFL